MCARVCVCVCARARVWLYYIVILSAFEMLTYHTNTLTEIVKHFYTEHFIHFRIFS